MAAILLTMTGLAADRPTAPRRTQQQLARAYPHQRVVNWCGGAFLGDRAGTIAVLLDEPHQQFKVLWVLPSGIQELDSVSRSAAIREFELQCLNPKAAAERQRVLRNSEAIESSLQVPAGQGAVCYFTDKTSAKCWSRDRRSGHLIEVGGWQT